MMIAKPRIDLAPLVGRHPKQQDRDPERQGVRVFAQALMDGDVTTFLGTEQDAQTAGPMAQLEQSTERGL
jgi:hypothetical protein